MAITIRNKATEELIRKIGRRTGEGPSAVIRRLAENENRQQPQGRVSAEEFQRRMAVFDELAEQYPPSEPHPTKAEIDADVEDIYRYLEDNGAASEREQ